ncbi:hypothetical protein B0T21DRAFT_357969 [Apiosordaria backusii]|uniref:Zn(2)-C6 fungal-type domain-containing protein n=1 Tax=Apiosordaria backusii TaxID=314023 RepID=A0AA40K3G9_9PEZI|nr:hypothetical protein B0T21DRAFT_357969 [Apiosordaria backusii]
MPRQSKRPFTSTRLPVNPRRKKVPPSERKRVQTACNYCNLRRVKCTGVEPCSQCAGTNRKCEYPEIPVKITVHKDQWDALKGLQAWVPHALELKRQLDAGELIRKVTLEDGRIEYWPAVVMVPFPEIPDTLQQPQEGDSQAKQSGPGQEPQQVQDQQQETEHQQHLEPPPHEVPLQAEDTSDCARSASPSSSSPLSKRSDFYLPSNAGFDPRSDEGRMLADSAGTSRYLGASSGATFLDNIKGLITLTTPLAELISKGPDHMFSKTTGRYQTDDSRALLGPPARDPVRQLPPASDIAKLLNNVRYFVGGGSVDDSFPSGGIMFWPSLTFGELSALGTAHQERIMTASGEQSFQVPRDDEQRTPLSLAFASFAFNRLLDLTGPDSRIIGRLGEDYYATSRQLLGGPLNDVTSTVKDAAVMGLLALYLVEINRRDNAHLWIKHAMHVCEVRGLHRNHAKDESEVRIFWTLYIIDSWLSCLLGRTPSIPDDGISLRLPQECRGFPSPIGLKAHLELSRISHKIIYNGLRKQSDATKPDDSKSKAEAHVKRSLKILERWLKELPPALQLPDTIQGLHLPDGWRNVDVPSDGRFGRDRACWALHMARNQLIILAVRPVLLTAMRKAIASLINQGKLFNIYDNVLVEEIRQCTDAAQLNLRLGCLMRYYSPHGRLLVQDLHHIFNAAVFLTMYQLVFVNYRTQLVENVDWAIEVFNQEQTTGCAYAKDCFEVLRDLRFLVTELRESIHSPEKKEELWDPNGRLQNYLGNMTATRNNTTSEAVAGVDVAMRDAPPVFGRPIKPPFGFKKGYAYRILRALRSWIKLEDIHQFPWSDVDIDGDGDSFMHVSSSDTNSNCPSPPGGF